MIVALTGNVIELNPSSLILCVKGVDYELSISLNTFEQIKDEKNLTIHTRFIVKENSHELFGFFHKEERMYFDLLTSVSGVGAKTALNILSNLDYDMIAHAIIENNTKAFLDVKGIGRKTAQNIILDLSEKVKKMKIDSKTPLVKECVLVLEKLGYKRSQVIQPIKDLISVKKLNEIELIVKEILKSI